MVPTTVPTTTDTTTTTTPEKQPCRNLTSAFEALCSVVTPDAPSPTAVLEETALPPLHLHPDLQRHLDPATVERVSCFSILHDMNLEISNMAAQDPSGGSAVVLLDAQAWLWSQFAEATTTHALPAETRTSLWKPGRSWWEAKSGKNPWMEPALHNQRWRYLWPLIHYHKFLSKTKKLAPGGVPWGAEILAVSDHLAALSLWTSAEWTECLQYFRGWTVAGFDYSRFVASVPLQDAAASREGLGDVLMKALQETPAAVPKQIASQWYDANSVQSELSGNSQMVEYMAYYPPQYASDASQHSGYAYPAYAMDMAYYAHQYYHAHPATPSPHEAPEAASPYWAHLDPAALVASPSPQRTPRRPGQYVAPLWRYPRHDHVPPSPATQFLMSPRRSRKKAHV